MLRLNKDKDTLVEIFNITPEEKALVYDMTRRFHSNETLTLSKVLNRIWMDEVVSDNVKCWAIFELGRFYEHLTKKGDM